MDSNTNTNQTITLIGIGRVRATTAENLSIGDTIVWNYGYRYTVDNIAPRGKTELTITERNIDTGLIYKRNVKRTRLIGVAQFAHEVK